MTLSGFASGRSTLLTATTIGTSAARACEIDSFVCGMTPSSAATTSTAMSVTFAPRARMAVNASWPGVSRNVIRRPAWLDLVGADVLRDPAGLGLDDRRLADRVEQRRLAVVDVAHDRDDRRPVGEVLLRVLVRLRLELLVGGVLDRHLTLQLGGDQLHLVVGQRLRRRLHRAEVHQDLDDLGRLHAERLRELLDGRRPTARSPGPVGWTRRRRLLADDRRSRAWRESGRGRPAAVSMTTRRLRPRPPRRPLSGAQRSVRLGFRDRQPLRSV